MVGKAGVGRRPGLYRWVKRGLAAALSGGERVAALRRFTVFCVGILVVAKRVGQPPYQVAGGRRRCGFTGFSALRSPCFGAVLVSGGLVVAGSARVLGLVVSPHGRGVVRGV